MLGRGGPEVAASCECLDDSDGIVDVPGEDYFAVILREHLATGRVGRPAPCGRANSELIEADDIVEFAVSWMADNLVT